MYKNKKEKKEEEGEHTCGGLSFRLADGTDAPG